MLIHRDIVEKIGLPDKRFFIVYDDTIYGFLASRYTNVAYVRDAILRKMLPLPKEQFTDRFIYFSMRNYFLRREYLNRAAPRDLYRYVRNINICAIFCRYIWYVLIHKNAKLKNLKFLFNGIQDGVSGRYGNTSSSD
jgi:GT2 family glycosyltransferase